MKHLRSATTLFLLMLSLMDSACGQNQRLNGLIVGQGLLFAGSVYGLSKTWYKKPLKNFHTFNDTQEWLQHDKVGHVYTAYQIARLGYTSYQWAGLSNGQAARASAVSGLSFMLPIEILDGFSPDYGFSLGDMAANISGAVLLAGQVSGWGEVRVSPKWSFRPTRLARERPELLGNSWRNSWLKDYNGQTYWMSANLSAFQTQNRTTHWPRTLNMAIGYGIDNMVAADYDKSLSLGRRPVRQFFISPDLDLTRIHTDSDFLRGLLFLANTLKIPAPAIEIRTSRVPPKLKIKFHAVYF